MEKCSFANCGSCFGELLTLYNCQKDITGHLRYLKVGGDRICAKEADLILYRSGLFDVEESCRRLLLVCQGHRDSLGIYWKPSAKNKCKYPIHNGNCKADRGVDFNVSREIFFLFKVIVPVGSGICKLCRSHHHQTLASRGNRCTNEREAGVQRTTNDTVQKSSPLQPTTTQEEPDSESHTENQCNSSQFSDCSTSFFGSQTQSSHEEWEPEITALEKLNNVIDQISNDRISPFRSQLSTPWDKASSRTQYYYRKQTYEVVKELVELIAPQQSEVLLTEIMQKHFQSDSDHDDYFNSMVASYQEAGSPFLKQQILSLFANQYPRETLLTAIPGLTKHKIDSARKYATVNRPDQLDDNIPVSSKLQMDKVQHFISFISQPQFIQDVAFGERILKLTTGQKIHIPHVVRTLIGSRIISAYLAYCAEVSFEALKRSSLYHILKQCSASQRKSLCGLDNTTADGMASFDKLLLLSENMLAYSADTRETVFKDIESRLRAAKRYLSHDYRWHIEESSQVKDHCIQYSLSHASSPFLCQDCHHEHNEICKFCSDTYSVIDDLEQLIVDGLYPTDEIRSEFIHDFQNCKERICLWKQHILRTVNQEAAKTFILENLKEDEVLIVMDWAMKFLPSIDREKQTDFYGKKGINWHVSVVLSQNDRAEISTDCYAHLFDSIPQGWFAVASILENLLGCIKTQNEKITKVYLRSDNAACYHCSPLIAAINGISKRTGVNICRYDFSEAQSGKDICDRRTAPMKIHAKRYGNEGHDITTARELKIALESYGGIQDTHVYTAEVDFQQQTLKKCSIPDINMFNNFRFEDDGVRMWLGYNIGEGKFVSYNSLQQTASPQQGATNLMILEHPKVTKRGKTSKRKRKHKETLEIHEDVHVVEGMTDVVDGVTDVVDGVTDVVDGVMDVVDEEINEYTCGECGIAFTSLKDFNIHQDMGNHKIKSTDLVKMLWSEKCVDIKRSITKSSSTGDFEIVENNITKGWALKGKRVSKRFSKKVKDFVTKMFQEGERKGHRYTPVEASRKIRSARDENGNRVFSPEEWLSSQQVQGLFCRLSQMSSFVLDTKEEHDEDLNEVIEEIARQENEITLVKSICM